MRFGQFRQAQRLLQFFLNLLRVRLEHAKALIVGLLRVIAREVDQRALVAPLRHKNMHACGRARSPADCSESRSSSASRSSKSTGT